MIITIADGPQIYTVDVDPVISEDGFVNLGGNRREVREIHTTKDGKQIELYPI